MPTVFRLGKYRFFFFSNEREEPLHIHVESEGNYAKFWLQPVGLAKSIGYNAKELNSLRKIVESKRTFLKEKWDEYFRDKVK